MSEHRDRIGFNMATLRFLKDELRDRIRFWRGRRGSTELAETRDERQSVKGANDMGHNDILLY